MPSGLALLLLLALGAAPDAGVAPAQLELLASHRLDPMLLREAAFQTLCEGEADAFPLYGALAAVPAKARAQVVRAAAEVVRAYLESPALETRYQRWRATVLPGRPAPARKKAQVLAELERDAAQQRRELEAGLATATRQQAKELRKQLEDAQRAVAAHFDSTDPEADELARYQDELRTWEEAVAATPGEPLVRARAVLENFLERSEALDFKAKLAPDGTFADEEHEAKGATWAAMFHLGPEAARAARTFAARWLEALPGRPGVGGSTAAPPRR